MDAKFCGERQVGQIGFIFGQRLNLFNDIHSRHARLVAILLATGQPAGIAPCAEFIAVDIFIK